MIATFPSRADGFYAPATGTFRSVPATVCEHEDGVLRSPTEHHENTRKGGPWFIVAAYSCRATPGLTRQRAGEPRDVAIWTTAAGRKVSERKTNSDSFSGVFVRSSMIDASHRPE